MEKAKKYLSGLSILLLVFAGLSLVRLIVEIALGGLVINEVPEGLTKEIMQIAVIVTLILSVLFMLPQIYCGIKGLKESNNPTSSRAHIVWAKIIFVLSVIALITPISALIQGTDILNNVLLLVDVLLNIIVYFLFIKYANKVSGK